MTLLWECILIVRWLIVKSFHYVRQDLQNYIWIPKKPGMNVVDIGEVTSGSRLTLKKSGAFLFWRSMDCLVGLCLQESTQQQGIQVLLVRAVSHNSVKYVVFRKIQLELSFVICVRKPFTCHVVVLK